MVSGKTFTDQEIVLDGRHYEKCTFNSCRFIYSGGGGFTFKDNVITGNTNIEFIGAAANTLNTMKGIYAMGDFGRAAILKTFQDVAPDIKNLH